MTVVWKKRAVHALLEEVSERGEQGEGDDVPVYDEHDLADAHVECRPGDNVEPCEQELQGQHSHEQLQLLGSHHHLSLSLSFSSSLMSCARSVLVFLLVFSRCLQGAYI